MRIPRIYTDQLLAHDQDVCLDGQRAHYLLKVLRMEAGRKCILFNGRGSHFLSTISSTSKKSLNCKIIEEKTNRSQSSLSIELAIGISKGDRMDWVLQKATELGVTHISPIFSKRSEVKLKGDRLDKKMQHWLQVIISSCEQCTRDILPTLNAPKNIDDFLAEAKADHKFVLHHRSDKNLNGLVKPTSACVLIGPEGGLDDDEILLAHTNQFKSLTLGPRVLRTETAPIAALSIMQYLWGDMSP